MSPHPPDLEELTGRPLEGDELEGLRLEAAAGPRVSAPPPVRAELPPIVVRFQSVARKKVTGWRVECEVHGKLPFLVKTRMKALRTGALHIRDEHAGRGRLVELEPRRRVKKERRRAA